MFFLTKIIFENKSNRKNFHLDEYSLRLIEKKLIAADFFFLLPAAFHFTLVLFFKSFFVKQAHN